jgi:hypothetical protein
MGMTGLLLLPLAAACGDGGGELKDVTARRRLEMDTTAAAPGDTSPRDTGYTLPTFITDTPAATAARPDSAAKDTAKPPAPASEWTAGPSEGRHPDATATLRGLRVAQQNGFDRLVLDFGDGPVPGWRVEYVDRPVRQCGSGQVAPVAGQAWLRIRLSGAQAHDDAGTPTVRQRDLPLALPVMKQLVMTCDFEGEVELVLGLAAPWPYKTAELGSPSRLVVDVRQQP